MTFLWCQVIVRWFCILSRKFDLGVHPLFVVILSTKTLFQTQRENIKKNNENFMKRTQSQRMNIVILLVKLLRPDCKLRD